MPTCPIREVARHRRLVSAGPAMTVRNALGPEITQFEAELQQRDDLSEKMTGGT